MDKKSFVMYTDQNEAWQMLTDEDAGKLIKAVFSYQTQETLPELPYAIALLFSMIVQQLKRDNEAYERRVSASRENGKKGGRPRKGTPVGYSGFSEKPKKGDNVNDSVNVNVNDNDTVSDMFVTRAMGATHTNTPRKNYLTFCEDKDAVYLTSSDFAKLCGKHGKEVTYELIRMRSEQKADQLLPQLVRQTHLRAHGHLS